MLTTRRQALKTLAAATLAGTALGKFPALAQIGTPAPPSPNTDLIETNPHLAQAAPAAASAPTGPFTLPPLPYGYDALEPHINVETMHLHHDKHHAAYVKKLNEALAKEPSFTPGTNVDKLVKNISSVPESIRNDVRNQGGGHANHSLFWQTLNPITAHQRKVSSPFWQALANDLGGMAKLQEEAAKLGAGLFGSGWVWLVLDGGKNLTLLTLPNQDSPLIEGHYPLFGIDVWEHAYYLKYHNLRADYIKAIWNVVNWDFISARYDKAMKG